MFGRQIAMSHAQHEALDYLIRLAEGRGHQVDGVLINNPPPRKGEGGLARFVLVIDNKPQTGSDEWDRLFSFHGGLLASGEGINVRQQELLDELLTNSAISDDLGELEGDLPLSA
jgi:hypothetical protein